MPTAIAAIESAFAGSIDPGDVFIAQRSVRRRHAPARHLRLQADLPGAALLAWAATICHHTDVGGRVPGSNASDSTEIYQEGLRIPPLKLYDARRAQRDAVRADREATSGCRCKVFGDLRAQLAACHIAEQAFGELAARYGAEKLAQLHDRADRLRRAHDPRRDPRAAGRRLRASPTISTTTASMSAGRSRSRSRSRKPGDQIAVDWTGTSPQVKGAINNTLSLHEVGELLRASARSCRRTSRTTTASSARSR